MAEEGSTAQDSSSVPRAILAAHRLFQRTHGTGTPPFWDGFVNFEAEFTRLLETACRLRNVDQLELCETLEDILCSIHSRWEEILKIRFCQALLYLPPVRRRGMLGDLGRIPPELLEEIWDRFPEGSRQWAMGGHEAAPSAWAEFLDCLPGSAKGGTRPIWPQGGREAEDRPRVREEILAFMAKEVLRLDRPLQFPTPWIGRSCLDLRFEAAGWWRIDARAVRHLLAWPDPTDLTDAMAGLSTANREILLGGMSTRDAELAWTVVDGSTGLVPWNRIIRAQRRLGRWLTFNELG